MASGTVVAELNFKSYVILNHLNLNSHVWLGARRGPRTCKGPEVGKSLVCPRNRKEVSGLVWLLCRKKESQVKARSPRIQVAMMET